MKTAFTALVLLLSACTVSSGRSPEDVVEQFHLALQAGDSVRALSLLHEKLIVLEAGGSERSRDEYAAQHLALDIAFGTGTQRTLEWRQMQIDGDLAWATSLTRVSGTHDGRSVNQQVAETMLLRREQGEWKIAHIHWSARRLNPT